ncbi:MAG TPA: murein biosynthesis integral membrane protein MurJ [Solirubrobacteraceae bacterium]|nr:murein biosynthesis integral membrane protein MurJ [Solirubrobacteraceae bacterium]
MSASSRPAGVDVATQSLARPAAVMAAGTALSRLTGLGRFVALAFALGVAESRLADAYNIANTLPVVLYELVLGGILTSVFVPILVQELRTKDREEAWRSVSALVSVAMAALVAMTLLIVALAPVIIDVFSTRVDGPEGAEQERLATFFLRIFAPQIVLLGATAVAAALINAHGRFGPPMFSPIVNNLILIATFLLFAAVAAGTPTAGSVADDSGQKLLLGLGATGGVAAMAAVNWWFVRRLGGRIRLLLDWRHPAVRRVAVLSLWTFLFVSVNALGTAVSFWLANGRQGGPTAYVLGFAFFQLPIGIAAVSIMTALVPKLSAHYVDGDDRLFRARLGGGLRATAMLMLPATAGYLVLADPLVQVLLQHGVAQEASARLVADVLRLFAVGLVPFAAFLLLSRAFYARQDNRTTALWNILAVAVTIGLDFALYPVWDVRGLALAHSLGFVVGAVVLAVVLTRRVGDLEARRTFEELAKVAAASILAADAMLAVVALSEWALDAGDPRALLQLFVGGAAGLATFVYVARRLDVEDLGLFRRIIPARFLPAAR